MDKLINNKFAKDVFMLVTGTALAQVVSLIAIPIIARLYSPFMLGQLGYFISIVSILAPIATLTYAVCIPLTENKYIEKTVINISTLITILMSSLIFILIIFYTIISKDLNIFLLYIGVPLYVFFSGITEILEQYNLKYGNFNINSRSIISQSLFINGSKILGGYLYSSIVILIVSTISSQFFRMFYMISKGNFKIKNFLEHIKKEEMLKVIKKYKDFPIYRATEITINTLSQSLPVILFSMFFGVASAGYYTIARSLLAMPSALITKSVGDVYYPLIGKKVLRKESIFRTVINGTLFLFIIGFIPFGMIFLYGDVILEFALGNEWTNAGEYAKWMALWTFFAFINGPCVRALPIINEQKFQLKFTIYMLIIRTLSLVGTYYYTSSEIKSLIIFSIVGALLNLYLVLKVLHKVKVFDESIELTRGEI